MNTLFLKILNMSITASWLILAVVLARLLLKKARKWVFCLLWGLVAIRLVCPFSLESSLSLIPSSETIPANIEMQQKPVIDSGITIIDETVNPIITESFTPSPENSANPLQIVIPFVAIVWITGVFIMLVYALISFLRLKGMVRVSVSVGKQIRACDEVKSPFILGVFRPIIYVPSFMSEETLDQVIRHEKAHLQRHDHWWKPVGFLLLAVYWFNPLCWIAYILLCRDIELACDEKVIRDMNKNEIAAYSQALLDCSFPRKRITACPLAFGEVGVKKRIRDILNYKKPAFWIILIAIIVCIALAIFLMTDPFSNDQQDAPVEVVEDNQSIQTGLSSDNPEYISGIKVMDLFLADMDQVFETLGLSGKECITEKVYIVKDGIEIQRDQQHYTSSQKVGFCNLNFQIAFFFNKDANTGSDVMTFVNYYRDYSDLKSLFADATTIYQELVKLYGKSSDVTGSQRFSILSTPEELQTSLEHWDVIEHWNLPDLLEEEMIANSAVNNSSMNPEVLKNYHCRLYIEKAAHEEGYRLYITYRVAMYAPSSNSSSTPSQMNTAKNDYSMPAQEEPSSSENSEPEKSISTEESKSEKSSPTEESEEAEPQEEALIETVWENIEEKPDKAAVWNRIVEQCIGQVPNLAEYETVWFMEDAYGWDILLKRPIDEILYDQITLHTSPDGTLDYIVVKEAKMDSVPDEVVADVQKQIEQYVAENESDCVSYEPNISYRKLEDGSIDVQCSLILHYEDGTSFGTLLFYNYPSGE